jgi:hypothetical protein
MADKYPEWAFLVVALLDLDHSSWVIGQLHSIRAVSDLRRPEYGGQPRLLQQGLCLLWGRCSKRGHRRGCMSPLTAEAP